MGTLSGIVLQKPRVLLNEVPAPFMYSVSDEGRGKDSMDWWQTVVENASGPKGAWDPHSTAHWLTRGAAGPPLPAKVLESDLSFNQLH